MNLHTAIREFTNQYDREAISSIQDLGTNLSTPYPNFLFEGVDIQKSADLFMEYLEGYAKYKISPANDGRKDNSTILEKTKAFLEHTTPGGNLPVAFEFVEMHTYDVPGACASFFESVQKVSDKVDELTSALRESYVSNNDIAALTEMGDMYITYLYPKMESIMEHALCASGYETKKWVQESLNRKPEPKINHVFV